MPTHHVVLLTPRPMLFIEPWLSTDRPSELPANVQCLTEREGGRDLILQSLAEVARDHFVDADILRRIGLPKAAEVLKAKVPTRISTQSGDLGEILATEYVREQTDYKVPINRLRHKDDRDTTMRGDDVIGFRARGKRVQVLKIEAKSRAHLSPSVVAEACESLKRHSSRPNPSTLAFISTELRSRGRDQEAELVENLLGARIADTDLEHLVFTLSGNDPTASLVAHSSVRRRRLTGIQVLQHQQFIRQVFGAIDATLR